RQFGAVREQGIVAEGGADAGQHRVGGMAQLLNPLARGSRADPLLLRSAALCAAGGRDPAVQADGGLDRDPGQAGADPFAEILVQALSLAAKAAALDRNAGFGEPPKSLSGDAGIRVFHARDDPSDAGGEDRLDAGGGTSGVRTGLQVDVKGRAARCFTRL